MTKRVGVAALVLAFAAISLLVAQQRQEERKTVEYEAKTTVPPLEAKTETTTKSADTPLQQDRLETLRRTLANEEQRQTQAAANAAALRRQLDIAEAEKNPAGLILSTYKEVTALRQEVHDLRELVWHLVQKPGPVATVHPAGLPAAQPTPTPPTPRIKPLVRESQ